MVHMVQHHLVYLEEVHGQIDMAKEQKGEGELDKLIRSLGTWDVS